MVQGTLGFRRIEQKQGIVCTMPWCANLDPPLYVFTDSGALRLGLTEGSGFGCGGDETVACCNVDAIGEQVVAVGKLERVGDERVLETPMICRLPSEP